LRDLSTRPPGCLYSGYLFAVALDFCLALLESQLISYITLAYVAFSETPELL
jgi:hypothetical protein